MNPQCNTVAQKRVEAKEKKNSVVGAKTSIARDKCKTRMKLGNESQDESEDVGCEMIFSFALFHLNKK